MKVPVPLNSFRSNNNIHPPRSLKSINSSTTSNPNPNPIPTFFHEAGPVFDLCRSPSPSQVKPTTTAPSAATADPLDHLEDEHAFQNFDWDSIMKELDFSAGTQQSYHALPDLLPHHAYVAPPEFSDAYGALPLDHLLGWNGPVCPPGLDYSVQELLRAADCLDYNDLHLAHVILDRLGATHQSHLAPLRYSPGSKPLLRAASLLKEALQSLLSPSTSLCSSSSDIVQTIRTYKTFSVLSPIPMFDSFTTNQALLDSITEFFLPYNSAASHASNVLHVVDFDIGLGCRYASLMRELASTASCPPDVGCKVATCLFLHVTAVVTEDYSVEPRLVKDSLVQFARELDLHFSIEFVPFRTFDMLSFKSVKIVSGERTAVVLSQKLFRRLGASNGMVPFVNELRRISPTITVCTEAEGWAATGDMNTMSFRKGIVSALEYYAMVFESLDAAGGDWGKKAEVLLLRPNIFAAVEGRRTGGVAAVGPSWREAFFSAGFRPVQLSRFADFQAECLLGKLQVRGFDVAKRQPDLVLCWRQRPLIAMSAWRCV